MPAQDRQSEFEIVAIAVVESEHRKRWARLGRLLRETTDRRIETDDLEAAATQGENGRLEIIRRDLESAVRCESVARPRPYVMEHQNGAAAARQRRGEAVEAGGAKKLEARTDRRLAQAPCRSRHAADLDPSTSR